MGFIGNFRLFPENRFRFDEVTAMSKVAPFLEHGVYVTYN